MIFHDPNEKLGITSIRFHSLELDDTGVEKPDFWHEQPRLQDGQIVIDRVLSYRELVLCLIGSICEGTCRDGVCVPCGNPAVYHIDWGPVDQLACASCADLAGTRLTVADDRTSGFVGKRLAIPSEVQESDFANRVYSDPRFLKDPNLYFADYCMEPSLLHGQASANPDGLWRHPQHGFGFVSRSHRDACWALRHIRKHTSSDEAQMAILDRRIHAIPPGELRELPRVADYSEPDDYWIAAHERGWTEDSLRMAILQGETAQRGRRKKTHLIPQPAVP